MPPCKSCKHYVVKYSEVIHKRIICCELAVRNNGCKGNYEPKEKKDKTTWMEERGLDEIV